jgi:SAM-dependent methyltransferase
MSDPQPPSFDPIWEREIYGEGRHLNRYPFDLVVSFVFRNFPRGRPRDSIRIVEVGCGVGNNLWFAAREGFSVSGLDASKSAIEHARSRFAGEGLAGDFRVGDFTELPWADGSFDLAVDRCSITCCGLSMARKAVQEMRRVLKPGGRALLNTYGDRHTSRSTGRPGPDGLTLDIKGGTLTGVGQICFYGAKDVEDLVGSGWKLLGREHLELRADRPAPETVHAEWRVVVEKTDDL